LVTPLKELLCLCEFWTVLISGFPNGEELPLSFFLFSAISENFLESSVFKECARPAPLGTQLRGAAA
jgi:hypothetical protein